MRQVRLTDHCPRLRVDRVDFEQTLGQGHRFLERIAGQRYFDGFEQYCRIVGKARQRRLHRRTRRFQILGLAVDSDQLEVSIAVFRVQFKAALQPSGALVIEVRRVVIANDQVEEMAQDQGSLQRRAFPRRKQDGGAQPVPFTALGSPPEFGGEGQDALAFRCAKRTERTPVFLQAFVGIGQQTAAQSGRRGRQVAIAAQQELNNPGRRRWHADLGELRHIKQQRAPVLRTTLDFQQQQPAVFVEIEKRRKPAGTGQDASAYDGRELFERAVLGHTGNQLACPGGIAAGQQERLEDQTQIAIRGAKRDGTQLLVEVSRIAPAARG